MTKPYASSKSYNLTLLLSSHTFEVPWHQRRYDWNSEEVTALLEDIYKAMKSEKDFYFLGTFLLIRDGKNRIINDGQQRITTYSMICAFFLNQFSSRKLGDLQEQCLRILLDISEKEMVSEADKQNRSPRLNLLDDQLNFELMIKEGKASKNGKLTSAWNDINDFVRSMPKNDVYSYLRFLIKKIEVSVLTLPNNINPNMIFESLNARGKPLEDLDLIRNYMYSFFYSKDQKSKRDTIKKMLEENLRDQLKISNSVKGIEKRITSYARCYFQCKYGFLPSKKFYKELRNNIENSSKNAPSDYIYDLIKELACDEYLEIFNIISRANYGLPFFKEFDADSGKSSNNRNLKMLLDEMRRYTVTQPILFALLSKYVQSDLSDEERKHIARIIYQAIKYVNVFVMRTVIILPKFEPSRFEKRLSLLASKIMKANNAEDLSKINILINLKQIASEEVFDDAKFLNAFNELEITSNPKASNFLYSINAYLQKKGDIFQRSKITLEHILPKSSSHWAGWKRFPNGKHNEYVYRIGNLTLLTKAENNSSAEFNRNWKGKEKTLKNSALPINKHFNKVTNWGKRQVEARQKVLGELAIKIWAFPRGKSRK